MKWLVAQGHPAWKGQDLVTRNSNSEGHALSGISNNHPYSEMYFVLV